jgi:hypothetical protein
MKKFPLGTWGGALAPFFLKTEICNQHTFLVSLRTREWGGGDQMDSRAIGSADGGHPVPMERRAP